jgi:hypothetical protein
VRTYFEYPKSYLLFGIHGRTHHCGIAVTRRFSPRETLHAKCWLIKTLEIDKVNTRRRPGVN